MTTKTTSQTKVVIAGGGFGGVRLARKLSGDPTLNITLISDRDYFAYYPQLYHAATGGVRSESAIPLTELFADSPVKVVVDPVASLDPVAKQITTVGKQTYSYDYLALALGSVTNYFGIKGLPEYSFNIKTIEGAEKFKQHLHQQVVEDKRMDFAYAIVGAGPTGTELSAALGKYLQRIAEKHNVQKPTITIDLIEAGPRVMPRSSEQVSAQIHKRLEKLGVTIMTNAVVEGETADALQLKGKDISSHTVVWTAGVANNPFFKQNESHFEFTPKGGRVVVDSHMQTKDGIYVMGDNVGMPFAGLAQVAVSDADFIAEDILLQIEGSGHRPDYKQKRPTAVTPVGDGWAIVERGNLHYAGYPGWLTRRAADLIAYKDIEPLGKAISVWRQDSKREDMCQICQPGKTV